MRKALPQDVETYDDLLERVGLPEILRQLVDALKREDPTLCDERKVKQNRRARRQLATALEEVEEDVW